MSGSMKFVYDELSKIENLKDKMVLSDCETAINIDFHEYLHLYVDDDYIDINRLTHWHPWDDEQIIEDITEIASGDIIYIEYAGRNPFKLLNFKSLTEGEFEKKKEKYMSKKHLRIYSGKSIIKRSER
ncbi:MAG: hypothetical protein FWD48_11890 [Oscillospiraceae bacterium]|nr:hypothetical protein [Oscillospiraceae bacterium]